MRTNRGAFTCGAVIVKLALRLPAGTVTLGGVTTLPSMLPLRRTVAPPAGAGDVSVTVPVDVLPLGTAAGLSVSDDKLAAGAGLPGGVRRIQACGARYPSSSVPVSMTTRVGTDTGLVVTVNAASVPPAGMTTVAGTRARLVSLLIKRTVEPPGGAALCKVTVPVNEVPPTTL